MIAVLITLKAKDGHDKELVSVLTDAARQVRANEPGCRLYRIAQALADKSTFKVFQEYASQQALDEHRQMPYAKTVGARLAEHLEEPGVVEFLNVVDAPLLTG